MHGKGRLTSRDGSVYEGDFTKVRWNATTLSLSLPSNICHHSCAC
jgi:hypothetical protein